MANENEIMQAILLCRFMPNSPITDKNVKEVTATFQAVLADLPAEFVKAASVQYLSENKFFPTPGDFRNTAMDLQMLSLGIPTAAEAWGMVLSAYSYQEPVFCETGAGLRMAYIENQTNGEMKAYDKHMRECSVCDIGGFAERYKHEAVAETVRMFGGREAIITDNPTADRARFIEAYREVVAKQRKLQSMIPQVRNFVEANRPALLDTENKIKSLAGMLKG